MSVENEKIRKTRNQYYREYRAKNKEKIRAINQRYWTRKAEKDKEVEENAERTASE